MVLSKKGLLDPVLLAKAQAFLADYRVKINLCLQRANEKKERAARKAAEMAASVAQAPAPARSTLATGDQRPLTKPKLSTLAVKAPLGKATGVAAAPLSAASPPPRSGLRTGHSSDGVATVATEPVLPKAEPSAPAPIAPVSNDAVLAPFPEKQPAWMDRFRVQVVADIQQTMTIEIKEAKAMATEAKNLAVETKAVVAGHTTRLDDIDAWKKRMEEKVAQLERGVKVDESADGFEPKFIVVRGMCAYDERQEVGMTRKEGDVLIEQLKQALTEELRQCVKRVQWRGSKVDRFKIFVDPSRAYDIKEVRSEWLEEQSVQFNNNDVYCLCERSPARQRRYNSLGRALDAVKKSLPQGHHVKPTFHPDFVLSLDNGLGTEFIVFEVFDDGKWEWHKDTEAVLSVTTEELERRMRRRG